MKAVFPFLTEDIYIDRFTLSKSIDNTFVKSEIQTEIKFTGENHDYLFRERLKGSDKETGIISHDCENQVFEKDVFISHNEGKFDLKRCLTTKKLNFANPLDCLIGVNKINIFDYPAGVTQTVEGTVNQLIYSNEILVNIGNSDNPITLEQVLGYLNGYPDNSGIGFFIEHISITVIPEYQEIYNQDGAFVVYTGHRIKIIVRYVRIESATQISSLWIQIPGDVGYYYSVFPQIVFSSPISEITNFLEYPEAQVYYEIFKIEAGKLNTYIDTSISNTINFNALLLGLFECTGLELVSNFFNINADATNPTNKYYEFATDYCQNIKIVQSFDIIRESSLEDSFGKSGFLTGKEIVTDISLLFNMMIVPDLTLGIVRWEHVSYFQTKGYDVTLRTDIDIAPFESDKEQIDSELFLMAQPTKDEFYQIKIKYNVPDLYKEENEKKYQVKKFLTDVFTTLNNPKFEGSEYESLFYLLSTDGSNIINLNNQFSINSIFRNLHDLNRPYKTGQIKDTYTDFAGFSIGLESTIKFFSSVITWDNIFPLMSIKTNLGTFKIDTVEANEKGLITLKAVK